MRVRWWHLALLLVLVLGAGPYVYRLAQTRQGKGILLLAAFAIVLFSAIAWLTRAGPRIRSSERYMEASLPPDDHMVP